MALPFMVLIVEDGARSCDVSRRSASSVRMQRRLRTSTAFVWAHASKDDAGLGVFAMIRSHCGEQMRIALLQPQVRAKGYC
jgi:hypothetical protein